MFWKKTYYFSLDQLTRAADAQPGKWIKISGKQVGPDLRRYLVSETLKSDQENFRWINPPGVIYHIRFTRKKDQDIPGVKDTIYFLRPTLIAGF